MNKTLKTCLYMLCVCTVLFGFGACKSQPEAKPEPKPQPVQPAAPEKNEEQEKAVRLLDELAKVRAEAVQLKADTVYPVQFKSADDTTEEAKQGYAANNFAAAQQKAQIALMKYRTLINQMQIAALKAKINKYDLSSYDAENYQKAEELSAKITELYDSDTAAAFETSVQALNYYESVTNAGFAILVDDAKKKADEARERCDTVKAAAAMKDDYEKAVTRYRSAGVSAGSKKYEQAYTGYMTAADEFNGIYEKVKIKRAQASDAMERAKARQDASSQLAKDADREAPLPDNAEGFSDEPVDLELLQRAPDTNERNTPAPQSIEPAPQPDHGTEMQSIESAPQPEAVTEGQSAEPASATDTATANEETGNSETGGNE